MASNVRIEKLQTKIKQRASEVIIHELNDPRLGFVTLTKVKLTRDMSFATIYYSTLGSESDRTKCAAALEHARGFVQREVGKILRTRITPQLSFKFDESVEGSIRVSRLLDEIKKERGDTEESEAEGEEESVEEPDEA